MNVVGRTLQRVTGTMPLTSSPTSWAVSEDMWGSSTTVRMYIQLAVKVSQEMRE